MIRAPGINPKTIGHIKGVPIGKTFGSRQECSACGVHAPWQAGIHGTAEDGAYSVVLSGGYPDDVDHGEFLTYTGSGGRTYGTYGTGDKKAWEGKQTGDQTWTMGNLALKRSFELQRPVRVIRGAGLGSRYAPAEGYRYDGLYMVVKAERSLGKQGFMMCKFEFSRLPHQPPLPTPGLTFVDTNKRKRAHRETDDDSSSSEEWFSEQAASSSNVLVEDIRPPKQRTRVGPQSALMRKVQSKAITYMRQFKLDNPPAKRPVTKALKTESDARCSLAPLVDPNLKEEVDSD